MLFKDQHLFAYEDDQAGGVLADILKPRVTKSFRMSGLADVRETLLIIEEYYAQMPRLLCKEASKDTAVDPVWLERRGERTYDRLLKVPLFIKQEKPSMKRSAEGETVDRPTTFHHALVIAHRLNYIPGVGDQIQFLNVMYDVTRVYTEAEDYFQQSGLPLYFRIESRISNFDGRKIGTCDNDEQKRDAGGSSTKAPDVDVSPDMGGTREQPASDVGTPMFTIPYI